MNIESFIIHQFKDESLSHYAYAIISQKEMILVDPARNPQLYYEFAKQHDATIVGVIETHPHADFLSSHLEISQTTGAKIYVSKKVGAEYEHTPFDKGDTINLANVILKALNTPGHSPDSICVVLESEEKDLAIFTGDTLFIGDCGRPDLRETAGNITATRENLAKDMYHSLRNEIMLLADDVLVYPAHGAGSLCGKGLSEANSSTVRQEKLSNWSLQNTSEKEFVQTLLADQPFVPKYFGFNVALNKKGANPFVQSIKTVPKFEKITPENFDKKLDKNIVIIDVRPQQQFIGKHFRNSINLQIGNKFETWLGSILSPEEAFYLTATTDLELNQLIERIAKIGYETQIKGAFLGEFPNVNDSELDLSHFKNNQKDYTIVDIRNATERKDKSIFEKSIHIPLFELRERLHEIPTQKPIVIHCAGGYRSAAGVSIVKNGLNENKIFDLSEAVMKFY